MKFSYSNIINPKDKIDSLAAQFVEQNINGENAHLFASQWYLDNINIKLFCQEMDVLIER